MSHLLSDLRAVSITLITRHSATCPHKDDPQYKRCNCWKHLRYAENGKMVWRATKQRTWAGAERVKHEFEQQHDPTRRQETASKVTVRDAIDTFVREKIGQNLAACTPEKYRLELDRLHTFLESAGVFHLAEVRLHHLTAFRATWLDIYPSSSTRNQAQGHLKTFFKYATLAYDLPRSPAAGLSSIKVTTAPTLPFTPAEYQAILAAIPDAFPAESKYGPRMLALTQLMRHSGLAIRDAACLRRDAIQKGADGVVRITTNRQKTKVLVRVPVRTEVAEALLALPEIHYGHRPSTGDSTYLFWDGKSANGVVRNYWAAFRKVFEKAGVKDGHPHRFRDTAAVEWLKSGLSLWQVSKLLGHSNPTTTAKHYAPWVQELQDQLDTAVMATWSKP